MNKLVHMITCHCVASYTVSPFVTIVMTVLYSQSANQEGMVDIPAHHMSFQPRALRHASYN